VQIDVNEKNEIET